MVDPVGVRGILGGVPLFRARKLPVESGFDLAFVVHTIKADDALEEYMQFLVAFWVFGDLVQGLEYVDYDLLERAHLAARLVHAVESGYLNEPADVLIQVSGQSDIEVSQLTCEMSLLSMTHSASLSHSSSDLP